jgi:hypothetical protein
MAEYSPLLPPEQRDRARLEKARAIAAERGGSLVSESVRSSIQKVIWECGRGHRWEAVVQQVQSGTWCPECQKPTIDDLQRHAAGRGGKCLAIAYMDSKTKMPWQCAKGHRWMSHWNSVQYHWCPKCAKIQKLDLEEFVRIARQRGGKLLSKEYINAMTPLLWRCAQGHTWWAEPGRVKGDTKYGHGSWCRTCAYVAQRGHRKPVVTLHDMREIARERGGECLSKLYINAFTKMEWRCARGHEWMATRTTIKRSWCPECAKKLEFEQVVATAADHGGKVLSPRSKFVNGATVLQWQCGVGHRWKTTVLRVRQGAWCARCQADSNWSLQDMKEIAGKHGGICLSRRYVHWEKPLRWRCSERHLFRATPRTVVRKKNSPVWCPVCSRYKYTIDDLQAIARERGGECLSRTTGYVRMHLRWRCAQGHVWRATIGGIVKGTWCAKCSTDRQRLDLGSLQEMARAHGAECLSTRYLNNQTPMRWRCARDHVFDRPARLMQRLSHKAAELWCPVCRREARQRMK